MSIYYESKGTPKQDFVIVKHSLPKFEGEIRGVKYRQGFGVVMKDSKTYQHLKRMKPSPAVREFPITDLKNLPFVLNEKQIEYIWGKAVYNQYQKKKKITPSVEAMHKATEEAPKCIHTKKDGGQCNSSSMKDSEYCHAHIVHDPRIKDKVEALPKMPVKEKRAKIKELVKKHIKKK